MYDSSESSARRDGGGGRGWSATLSVGVERLRALSASRGGRGPDSATRSTGRLDTAPLQSADMVGLRDTYGVTLVPSWTGDRLADRYRLEQRLGAGTYGTVWRALDELSGERVAIKVYRRRNTHALREELTALQWVDLPGVVRLRDDGEDGGRVFVVMDLVVGAMFPGRTGAPLREMVARLLEVLVRLHGIGIHHGDLKPANCMVDDTGQPVLLDLGLARGAALGREDECYGSPAFAAPEQRATGKVNALTDLYTVGVMARNAMAESDAPDDPALRRLVDALLEFDRERRPQSAMAALAMLDEGHRIEGLPPLRPAASPADLEALFAGPEPFLHLRSQAAAALWARTDGRPDALARELRAWLRRGIAWPGDDGLHLRPAGLAEVVDWVGIGAALPDLDVSPAAHDLLCWIRLAQPLAHVERLRAAVAASNLPLDAALAELRAAEAVWTLPDGSLATWPLFDPTPMWKTPQLLGAHAALATTLPPDHPMAVRHALAADMAAPGLLARVAAVARRLVLDGRSYEAQGLLGIGLKEARRAGRWADEQALLPVCALEALIAESPTAIRLVRYQIGRAQHGSLALERLDRLLAAAEAETHERAHPLLDAIGELDDADLERERQALRLKNARRQSVAAEAALVDALASWVAEDPARRTADWLGWRGELAYRQNDFRTSAQHFAAAIEASTTRKRSLTWRVDEAAALLEFDPAEALVRAHAVGEEAAALHLARVELSAYFIARSAEYRLGRAGPPRPDHVDAAATLGRGSEAMAAVIEAAAGWRWGAVGLARALAERAARRFAEEGRHEGAELCFALAVRCGAPVEPERLRALAERVMSFRVHDFAVQILGLLAWAWPPGALATQAAEVAAIGRPTHEWGDRLDVLSYAEALMLTGGGEPTGVEQEQSDV